MVGAGIVFGIMSFVIHTVMLIATMGYLSLGGIPTSMMLFLLINLPIVVIASWAIDSFATSMISGIVIARVMQ